MDVATKTIATAFIDIWVAHSDCPSHVTMNRGCQFDCALFIQVTQFCDMQLHRTTSYHLVYNSTIEQLHQTLKSTLTCHNSTWMEALLLVVLGLTATTLAVTLRSTLHITHCKKTVHSKNKCKSTKVSKEQITLACISTTPPRVHFIDPAEDLLMDDASSTTNQTEPAPVTANDSRMPPAVIMPPHTPQPHPTLTSQLAQLPKPHSPQAPGPTPPSCQQTTSHAATTVSN
ncbi:uncharacterized protein LOC124712390 [Schistocerca piceifrons]|uniref:uncharacterized protein LOC124712390 n=1 Tax=Schistocerca piceifrons TaxID=274613 RepID=UPI001F5E4CCE|nr:uncharacterized protein LOC124712390 [Schistocerca piceifrons]